MGFLFTLTLTARHFTKSQSVHLFANTIVRMYIDHQTCLSFPIHTMTKAKIEFTKGINIRQLPLSSLTQPPDNHLLWSPYQWPLTAIVVVHYSPRHFCWWSSVSNATIGIQAVSPTKQLELAISLNTMVNNQMTIYNILTL